MAAPASVEAYLDTLPADRRAAVSRVRAAVNAALPTGYEEGMQYGMIGWYVPHARYPAGYHCDAAQPVPFLGLGAQKAHIGVYPFCAYVDPALRAWLVDALTAAAAGRAPDMGAACVRFKKPDAVPAEVFGALVAQLPVDTFLASYVAQIPASARKKAAARRTAG